MNICALVLASDLAASGFAQTDGYMWPLGGRPVIARVRDTLAEAGIRDQLYIIGQAPGSFRHILGEDIAYVLQEDPEHLGAAILQASSFLESRDGLTLVVPGNMPLLEAATLRQALRIFEQQNCDALWVCAGSDQEPPRCQETFQPDFTQDRGGGLFIYRTARLLSVLGRLGTGCHQPPQAGDSCPDLSLALSVFEQDGLKVRCLTWPGQELLQVKNTASLNQASDWLSQRIQQRLQQQGVTIEAPGLTYIEETVSVGARTVIRAGCRLYGHTRIGENCVLGPDSTLEDCEVGADCHINRSVLEHSVAGTGCRIGPYAWLHDACWLDRECRVGAAEISNAVVGPGCVIDSRVFLADCDVGEGVRLGSGATTVNDDGSGLSYRSAIGNLAMIGANSSLVAPVDIGANAYIAAGSVITDPVPEFALALGRGRQALVPDWVRRRRARPEGDHLQPL
ncbi:MAG: NTP transferase domain-containing protein [Oscillospiraceae bacterium]|nr:NTP transferase domain-containing protein [Oscillospiraceae bacterium]MDD4367349.1 NTP transferase domain-containing protein [Oscillospiraceae bacterium]